MAVVARARELGESSFTLQQPSSTSTSTSTATADVAVVAVDVRENAGEFDVAFEGTASGQPFTRQLRTSTCNEAAEATALLVAMMVQTGSATTAAPDAVVSSSADSAPGTRNVNTDAPLDKPQSSSPVTPKQAVPSRKPIAAALPRDADTDRSNLDSPHYWSIGAALSANQAILPTTALGVVAHLGYEYRWLRFSVEGAWLPPVDQRLHDTPDIGARVRLWSAALRTRFWQPVFWQPVGLASVNAGWFVTLAAEVGSLRGEAYGTEDATARAALWLAGSGGVGGLVKISETWSAVLLAEAVIPVTRTEFNLRNVGPIDAAGAVGARTRLGLEAQF
jgi:hypothetical protein